ncbi:MAG: Sec-independent protein translocase protein TatB [Beijerinckiaceae bacterium]
MFDFSAAEFLVIGLVALIVIGPKELPGLLRQFGQMVGKVRRMASDFQEQLNTAVEQSEVQDIKKELNEVADKARVEIDYDPAYDAEQQIREAVHGAPKKAEIKNPEYGDDPDGALIDFPSPGETPAAEKTATASSDNAIIREPSAPRASAPAKRLPVTTGAQPDPDRADSVAAEPHLGDGKPTAAGG